MFFLMCWQIKRVSHIELIFRYMIDVDVTDDGFWGFYTNDFWLCCCFFLYFINDNPVIYENKIDVVRIDEINRHRCVGRPRGRHAQQEGQNVIEQ